MKTPHPASPARGEEGDRPIRSVGIVGLGLIGGSLAKALKAVGGVRVIGYDIDAKSVREARDSGIECVGTLAALAKGSDLIVMASPIETTEDVFRKIAPALRRGQVVTDVGSVKAPIVAAARRILPARVDFIGGHPMAGSERSGFGVSRPDLFGGSPWILTFDDRTNSAAYLRLMALLLRLGVRIVPMTAEDHDDAVSQISHLPHVIAYTLMSQASAPSGRAMRKELAAGSFRDLVRVSGASPRIWTEICRRNQARVRLALGDYVARLIDVQGALRRGDFDRLRAIFEEGHQGYLRLSDDQRARRTVPLHSGQIRGRMVKVLTDVAARGGRIERKIYRR